MKCAIIAGGLGTRLRPVIGDLPKPMAPLDGVPLLERHIGLCRRFGITDIHLLLGYRPEVIREYFGDGAAFGVRITYWIESQPMGTAGCMAQMRAELDGDILILYGDVFVEMDLARLIEFHRRERAAATLVVHPNDHPQDSDLTEVEGNRVTAFHPKPHPEGAFYANIVNAAVHVASPGLFRHIAAGEKADFGHDVFPKALAAGDLLAAYSTPEYIKDTGTPERYRQVEADIRAGKPGRCSLINRRKAVFLDRDGTINVLVPLLSRMEDLELYPGAARAIRAINQSEYLTIVVSNQPQLARGLLTEKQLQEIHNKLETLLGKEGARLDAIYYCPHHPDRGYPEEVSALKTNCRCRKPDTLLFERAAERFHIDPAGSVMIGDSARDMEAARRFGCHAVLVKTGAAGNDGCPGVPDHVATDLAGAVDWVLGAKP